MTTTALRTAVSLSGILLPGVALANTVVIAPFIPHETVDEKQVVAVHQLTTSELEFQPGVDSVVDLGTRPATLDPACLDNPSCLKTITAEGGGDQLVTGVLASVANNYHMDLLLYDKNDNRVVRRKIFAVPTDPTAFANAMTGVVKELLTGTSPEGAAAAAAPAFAGTPAQDDIDFVPAPPTPVAAAPAPAPAPVQQPPPPASDADAAAMISFGGSVEDITAEEIDSMIKFGAPSSGPAPTPAPVAAAPAPQPAPVYQPAAQPQPQPQPAAPASTSTTIADLDQPSRGGGGLIDRPGAEYAQLVLRGGYSKYYAFNFITFGGELAVPVYEGLHLLAGVEAYAVQRELPPEQAAATGIISEWNTIYPLTLGGFYKFTGHIVQPYVGGDGIMVQYYSDEIGADWAGGARLRGGVDIMFINNFGINANVAVGAWTGQNFPLIDAGVKAAGVLPAFSAGTVVAF